MEAIVAFIVALALGLLGTGGFITWSKIGVANVQTAATASQNIIFNKASDLYLKDNGSAIAAVATATTPVTVTSAMLTASGYLPTGFTATNPFRQTWQLQVLQPVAGKLQAMVTSQGGNAISSQQQLVQIGAQVGAQGGFVPYANQAGDATMNAATAYGAYGAWKVPLAGFTNPGSGHLASLLSFTGAQANNGYLYRVQVAGQPQLNAMQTDLGMTDAAGAKHNITGANSITANTATLAAGNSLNIGGGAIYYGDTVNAAIRTNGALYLQTPNGLGAADIAQVGNVNSAKNINAAGTMTATNVNFNTAAASCSWGQVTMRGNNQMWVCNQYGGWVLISQLIGNVHTVTKYVGYMDGYGVGKPPCTGGVATALITPTATGVNVAANPPWETTRYSLTDMGTFWVVAITMFDTNGTAFSGSNLGLTAEVDTQCSYANGG